MFGDALLVAAFTDDIHLPAGTWYNFWTDARHEGPCDLSGSAPADRGGPLFVRAGALIPQWPQLDYIGQKPIESITWDVWPPQPGAASEFTLYEDDGVSFGYRDGAVATTQVGCEAATGRLWLTFAPRQGVYPNMPAPPRHRVRLHAIDEPRSVSIHGVAVEAGTAWTYDRAHALLTMELADRGGTDGSAVVEVWW
jgi:hypothetical protein